jgi:hypothetical protein
VTTTRVNDFDFSLRMNNCATNDPCAICGARTDPAFGVELFCSTQGEAPGLVCDTCGSRLAPTLYALRSPDTTDATAPIADPEPAADKYEARLPVPQELAEVAVVLLNALTAFEDATPSEDDVPDEGYTRVTCHNLHPIAWNADVLKFRHELEGLLLHLPEPVTPVTRSQWALWLLARDRLMTPRRFTPEGDFGPDIPL